MSLNRELLGESITVDAVPEWYCPYCSKGVMKGGKNNFKILESNGSKADHKHDEWQPDWISGIFGGLLTCSNIMCKEQVIVSGRMSVEDYYDCDEDIPFHYHRQVLYPLHFVPTIPIFRVSKDVPKHIALAVTDAFDVFWQDKASCGNKIRRVVELIVEERKVPKRFTDRKGKRQERNLHTRIELFGKSGKPNAQKASELLMAVKWIGNSGSHTGTLLHHRDILDGLEILSHVLDLLYDKDHLRIYKLSKAYNKSRGPLKRHLFSTRHLTK